MYKGDPIGVELHGYEMTENENLISIYICLVLLW